MQRLTNNPKTLKHSEPKRKNTQSGKKDRLTRIETRAS